MLNKSFLQKIVLYSLLAALACCLFVMVLYKGFNINPLGGKKEIAFVFTVIAMIFACIQLRSENQVVLPFKKSFSATFMVGVLTIFFTVIGLYIVLGHIYPNLITEYINATQTLMQSNKSQIIKNGISEQAFNDAYSGLSHTNTETILTDHVIKHLLLSMIPSLMISLYFTKNWKT